MQFFLQFPTKFKRFFLYQSYDPKYYMLVEAHIQETS